MRESYVLYKSFWESIKHLDNDIQLEMFRAMCQYNFEGNEGELSEISKSLFTLMKPQFEANNIRFENGKKGGRPKTKTKPKQNQNKT